MRISDWSSDVCSSDLENIGHFGLALEAYAHFTSPIRRYPDLLVHREIKHALAGGDPDRYRYSHSNMSALSLQCSERSRRADEAQRAEIGRDNVCTPVNNAHLGCRLLLEQKNIIQTLEPYE